MSTSALASTKAITESQIAVEIEAKMKSAQGSDCSDFSHTDSKEDAIIAPVPSSIATGVQPKIAMTIPAMLTPSHG